MLKKCRKLWRDIFCSMNCCTARAKSVAGVRKKSTGGTPAEQFVSPMTGSWRASGRKVGAVRPQNSACRPHSDRGGRQEEKYGRYAHKTNHSAHGIDRARRLEQSNNKGDMIYRKHLYILSLLSICHIHTTVLYLYYHIMRT